MAAKKLALKAYEDVLMKGAREIARARRQGRARNVRRKLDDRGADLEALGNGGQPRRPQASVRA